MSINQPEAPIHTHAAPTRGVAVVTTANRLRSDGCSTHVRLLVEDHWITKYTHLRTLLSTRCCSQLDRGRCPPPRSRKLRMNLDKIW